MSGPVIRPEEPRDSECITRVTVAAFQNDPHGDHTEHFVITALRRAGALTLSLVAEVDGHVVGHCAFSPVSFPDRSPAWYGLGPVAVLPEFQRQGIGHALITHGLAALRARGAAGCVVLGDPAYYQRFGFRHRPGCFYVGVPPEYLQLLAFGPTYPVGPVSYHEAFNATSD